MATKRPQLAKLTRPRLNRVMELLKGAFDANAKVTAAGMLQEYAAVAMDLEVMRRTMEIAHPLLDSPELSAPCAMLYFQAEGYTYYLHGKYDLALADFDAAARIARENDFQNGIANSGGVVERRVPRSMHRARSDSCTAVHRLH